MTIEQAIRYGVHVRDVHRDDVERATDIGFPLRQKRPWGNQW